MGLKEIRDDAHLVIILPWVIQARADRDDSLPLCLIKFVLNCFLALRVTARGERGGRPRSGKKSHARENQRGIFASFLFTP